MRAMTPGTGPTSNERPVFRGINRHDINQVAMGLNSGMPTIHEGSDYINLGAGLPANQIPPQVQAAYPASVNGGSAYTHEYTYPHPLVTGGPSPTPTATPSPTATATATATATFTPTATAGPSATATATIPPTPTPTATPHCDTDTDARLQRLLRVVLPQ